MAARAAQDEQHKAAIRQVGVDFDARGKTLMMGWKHLNERLSTIGITSLTSEEGLIILNVGGACVVFRRGAVKG